MRNGDITVEQIAELWVLSLSYPPVASLAWRVLTFWVNRAERVPAVATHLLAVIRSIAGVAEIAARLRHQMRHVWLEQRPPSVVLTDIAALVRKA
jgi:hypothetical protein